MRVQRAGPQVRIGGGSSTVWFAVGADITELDSAAGVGPIGFLDEHG